MKKTLIILIICSFLVSCMTEKRALRITNCYISNNEPYIAAICAFKYPVKDSIITDTVTVSYPLWVNDDNTIGLSLEYQDSLKNLYFKNGYDFGYNIAKRKCKDSPIIKQIEKIVYRRDVAYESVLNTKINRFRDDSLKFEGRIVELNNQIEDAKLSEKKQRKQKRTYLYSLIGLGLINLLMIFKKIFKFKLFGII